uniref:hypothetical protein n=1 Tax=Flavobacterium sp. TaxID=239 RepID=UPI00404B7BC3
MKKILLMLFIVAGLASCSNDDSNGIAINSSDNQITLNGVKQDYLSNVSYYWTSALIPIGDPFEGHYRHVLYTEGNLGADYLEMNFALYSNSITYPTGTLTYSETATGNAIIGNVVIYINNSLSYSATAGNIKIKKLSGSIHRITMDLTITDGTTESVLKGIIVDSLIRD